MWFIKDTIKSDLAYKVYFPYRLHQIMEQLNTGNALSLTDMKQELGRAVAMLDKANSTSPVKELRYLQICFAVF